MMVETLPARRLLPLEFKKSRRQESSALRLSCQRIAAPMAVRESDDAWMAGGGWSGSQIATVRQNRASRSQRTKGKEIHPQTKKSAQWWTWAPPSTTPPFIGFPDGKRIDLKQFRNAKSAHHGSLVVTSASNASCWLFLAHYSRPLHRGVCDDRLKSGERG